MLRIPDLVRDSRLETRDSTVNSIPNTPSMSTTRLASLLASKKLGEMNVGSGKDTLVGVLMGASG